MESFRLQYKRNGDVGIMYSSFQDKRLKFVVVGRKLQRELGDIFRTLELIMLVYIIRESLEKYGRFHTYHRIRLAFQS